jgi:hypothetical protein
MIGNLREAALAQRTNARYKRRLFVGALMMVHNVFFWLRADLPAEAIKEFEAGLASLVKVPAVRHGFWGRPAKTDRPIIDRTYSYGLTLAFENLAGHDVYQEHPIHLAFVMNNKSKWTDIKIYDFE